MSDILARIRVTEAHGIRRFLYPLHAFVSSPIIQEAHHSLCLVSEEGQPVPVQVAHIGGDRFRVDFAVSVEPGATQEYHLMPGAPKIVDDPLQIRKRTGGYLLHSRQQRFEIALLDDVLIGEVVYDGVRFLRDSVRITCNGQAHTVAPGTYYISLDAALTAWAETSLWCPDGRDCDTNVTITACKSWATVTHTQHKATSGEEIVFTLPLAITSPTLTCDFGVGGYVFGKLQAGGAEEVVWRTQFTEDGSARWTVATAGRLDYVGEATATEFVSERWFHLIDSDKALAVAITEVPTECAEMTVTLRVSGDVIVAFRLGEVEEGKRVAFGVCYHFLNDVPAIAAATNPQSILLPPTVEVL